MGKRHIIDVSLATLSEECKNTASAASTLREIPEMFPNPDVAFENMVGRYSIDEESGQITISLLERTQGDLKPMLAGVGPSYCLPSQGRLMIELDFLNHVYQYLRGTFHSIDAAPPAETDSPTAPSPVPTPAAPTDLFASMLGVTMQ